MINRISVAADGWGYCAGTFLGGKRAHILEGRCAVAVGSDEFLNFILQETPIKITLSRILSIFFLPANSLIWILAT